MNKVAIVLNSPTLTRLPSDDEFIICADGGASHIEKADILLGDMDSITSQIFAKKTIVLPVHKDVTDGEFAMKYAIENLSPTKINLYGVTGGRIDHVLGNLALFTIAHKNNIPCFGKDDNLDIYFTDSKLSVKAKENDTISIVPFNSDAIVSLDGFEYPAQKLTIPVSATLGISNRAIQEEVKILVHSGCVFVFHNITL